MYFLAVPVHHCNNARFRFDWLWFWWNLNKQEIVGKRNIYQLHNQFCLCFLWTCHQDKAGRIICFARKTTATLCRTVARKLSTGGLCSSAGGLDIIKLTKTPLIYRVSRFNLEGLELCLGGISPRLTLWRMSVFHKTSRFSNWPELQMVDSNPLIKSRTNVVEDLLNDASEWCWIKNPVN